MTGWTPYRIEVPMRRATPAAQRAEIPAAAICTRQWANTPAARGARIAQGGTAATPRSTTARAREEKRNAPSSDEFGDSGGPKEIASPATPLATSPVSGSASSAGLGSTVSRRTGPTRDGLASGLTVG